MGPTSKRSSPRPALPRVKTQQGAAGPEEFPTPGKKTIDEVAEFDVLPTTSHIKSLVMVADGKPLLILLRGNDQLSDAKLGALVGTADRATGSPG